MSVLWQKVAIAIALGAGSYLIYRFRDLRLARVIWGSETSVWSLVFLFRIIPFLVIYVYLGFTPQSDVISYFWPQATEALTGRLVHVQFESNYSPLFPYINAVAISVWPDPRAIVALMILMEIVTLWLSMRIFSYVQPKPSVNFAACLYLLSPTAFLSTVLGGQEDLWMWLFAIGVIGLLHLRRDTSAAWVSWLGALSTKLLFIPPISFLLVRSPQALAGIVVLGVISFAGLFYSLGSAIFQPLREAAYTSPPNIWYVFYLATGGGVSLKSPWLSALSLGTFCVVMIWLALKLSSTRNVELQSGLWIFFYVGLMIFSPKTLSNYASIFLIPIIFLAFRKNPPLSFPVITVMSTLASFHSTLWYRLQRPTHSSLATVRSPALIAELSVQLALLALLIFIGWRYFKWLLNEANPKEAADTNSG